MRWMFASVLAGLVTLVLFFGMMRVEGDSEEEALKTVRKPDSFASVSWGEMAIQPQTLLNGKSEKRMPVCVVDHRPCHGHPIPKVQYPRTGTTARLPDTDCDVSFVIGVDGRPQDIEVDCGHPAFEDVSREAIAGMQYVTEDMCGPCERSSKSVTYPLRFRHE